MPVSDFRYSAPHLRRWNNEEKKENNSDEYDDKDDGRKQAKKENDKIVLTDLSFRLIPRFCVCHCRDSF